MGQTLLSFGALAGCTCTVWSRPRPLENWRKFLENVIDYHEHVCAETFKIVYYSPVLRCD